jgi:hypothetical protein
MIFRALILTAAILGGLSVDSASAYSPSERAAIRAMPITQRPYRVGHVYGNTVRFFNRIGGR